MPVRKGTAHIIKNNSPIIVSINIKGFNHVFQRNGLKILSRKKKFSIEICDPITEKFSDYSIDQITEKLERIIN